MSAYMFVEIAVRDAAVYEQYMREIPRVIAQYGGEYVVRSSKITPVAGAAPERVIVMRFESTAALRRCFGSVEYAALAQLREQATATRSFVVED